MTKQMHTKKIFGLVVEDESTIRESMAKSLAENPMIHFIVQAQDGKDALNKLEYQDFHFAVIDLNMPHVDGLDLISRIRRKEKLFRKKAMPIIIVSGTVESEAVKKAKDYGVRGIIVKPYKIEEITEKVGEIIRGHLKKAC